MRECEIKVKESNSVKESMKGKDQGVCEGYEVGVDSCLSAKEL